MKLANCQEFKMQEIEEIKRLEEEQKEKQKALESKKKNSHGKSTK